jgi:hypothetical protein
MRAAFLLYGKQAYCTTRLRLPDSLTWNIHMVADKLFS